MTPQERMDHHALRDLVDGTAKAQGAREKAKRPWSSAKRTRCQEGHNHASKMEARVCDRLALLCRHWGYTLFQQVRLPLWNLAPGKLDRALVISIDFAIVEDGRLRRLIDAKSPTRVSRDWKRGAAAVEACYGIKVEEVSE